MKTTRIFNLVFAALLLVVLSAQTPALAMAPELDFSQGAPSAQTLPESQCHFGITALGSFAEYDLSSLGVGSYLDWGNGVNQFESKGIAYYRVINVEFTNFNAMLSRISNRVALYPGAVWMIGNEPDSEVAYQDHVSPEVYAERFYTMATAIRLSDPSAKIGFGTIIQPTPLRMHYLDRVIERLDDVDLAGSRAQALGLIDIYSTHAFILNEERVYDGGGNVISWGAGLPLGYVEGVWPAPQVISGFEPTETINIDTFKAGIIRFRQWMDDLGEQNKPLWVTEYGSLFPTSLSISDAMAAAFMEQTFDFMLGTKDADLGYAGDDYRLVQRWLWYSLHEDVDRFGGSLFNPSTKKLTAIGERFIKYNPAVSMVPVTNPDVYVDMENPSVKPGGIGNYLVTFKVSNHVSSDRLTPVTVDLYLGNTLVGSGTTTIPRCGGRGSVTIAVNHILASGGQHAFTAHVQPAAGNGTDLDPSNDSYTFPATTIPGFYYAMLPVVSR